MASKKKKGRVKASPNLLSHQQQLKSIARDLGLYKQGVDVAEVTEASPLPNGIYSRLLKLAFINSKDYATPTHIHFVFYQNLIEDKKRRLIESIKDLAKALEDLVEELYTNSVSHEKVDEFFRQSSRVQRISFRLARSYSENDITVGYCKTKSFNMVEDECHRLIKEALQKASPSTRQKFEEHIGNREAERFESGEIEGNSVYISSMRGGLIELGKRR